MSQPNYVRPTSQFGSTTYKLKIPHVSPHALYFTIVDLHVDAAQKSYMFFINSKEMNAFQWISALMVSYSRQIASGTPVEDLICDMKETFDPNGSYIIQGWNNIKVNSIIHHLGLLLEKHIENKTMQ